MLKNQAVISKLSLEEKALLMSGKSEWESYDIDGKVPVIFMSDGPHGIRKQEGAGDHLGLNASVPATCFPTAATMANSWDQDLVTKVGQALGNEALSDNVQIVLGPGMNTKRNPRCGRNFEYYSEDPYLAGKMAAALIRGMQSTGTFACPKHFAANSQEYRRMASNSVIDERTFRELYTTNFEIAVKEGHPKAIMSSYNEINGIYANENKQLLTDILRKEWGFEGMVVTDWGGDNDHVKGVQSGSNLVMPTLKIQGSDELVKAVKEGHLAESDLDKRVDELLSVIFASSTGKNHPQIDFEQQHAIARKAASESVVLLKNEQQLLPLKKGTKVAVIGDFAQKPRYQGAGSSLVNATKVETINEEIKKYPLDVVGYAQGYKRNSEPDQGLISEAKQLAAKSEVALIFAGLDEIAESEGLDRDNLKLSAGQTALIEVLTELDVPVIVVLSAGSVIELPWLDKVQSLVHGYLGGQAQASAMLDVLCGKVNPSGKLAETYMVSENEVPFNPEFPAQGRNSFYKEGLFVGYRYYDSCQKDVNFPFGFGLSYTNFAYSDLQVSPDKVTFSLTNTGKVFGKEIAQLYIGKKDSNLIRPLKELKGFVKVALEPGETKTVTIPFDDKTFRFYDVKTQSWQVEKGTYQVYVGANSRDILLTGEIVQAGIEVQKPSENLKYYRRQIEAITDEDFAELYGKALPQNDTVGIRTLKNNDTIAELQYAKNILARQVYKILKGKLDKSKDSGTPDLNILFIYNMPFRAIAKMTHGAVNQAMVADILQMVNGHFFKGLGSLISNYFKNQKRLKAYRK